MIKVYADSDTIYGINKAKSKLLSLFKKCKLIYDGDKNNLSDILNFTYDVVINIGSGGFDNNNGDGL